jgi:hypothetical protein
MKKLKAIWYILESKGFYIITNRGACFNLPAHKEVLEAMQDEIAELDMHLDDLIIDLTLEEN